MNKLTSLAARFETPAYAALRIAAGSMLAVHGAQKVLGWFGSAGVPPVGSQLWVGGVLELVGGALIAAGLFTRAAAFITSGMMAVAYIQFHWKLQFAGNAWLPQVNQGELAVLYSLLFLFIMGRGPGAAALDNVRQRSANAPAAGKLLPSEA